MTVLGENPGEEYFEAVTTGAVGTFSTKVAWITGLTVGGGNADLTGLTSGTSSITIGGTNTTNTYYIVSGW